MNKKDITNRADIELLVNTFYDKVKRDPLLSPVFEHLDWPKHLPSMYHFWTFNLLGEAGYKGNIIQKHLPLNISAVHFTQWLKLFNATVDELFTGDKAEEAKSRAYSMAVVIQVKLGVA